ncbi:MAG: hypothetical protein LBI94_08930, partial [Treponema sp.]|nr:hypothetical protein [Treponema sp.]
SAGKIRGPHPRFFPPTPRSACFASLFAGILIVNYLMPRVFQGKKMVKWLPVRFHTAAGTIDHF